MRAVRAFLKMETSSGWLLLFSAAWALVWINTPWFRGYEAIVWAPIVLHWNGLLFEQTTFLEMINHFGMTFFFLLVGLEIKREFCFGALRTVASRVLPAVAAVGGMVVPAVLYSVCNIHSAGIVGWGIPMATDIAFALGVLSLLGHRVPITLKLFLMALAIFDDIGAMIVIAVGYGQNIQGMWLLGAGLCTLGLWACQHYRILQGWVYGLLGFLVWFMLSHAGIHGTLAGIIVALAIPLRHPDGGSTAFGEWETRLHPYVAYGIVPIFAFLNAGVRWVGMPVDLIWNKVSFGVILGLCLGKWLGIVGSVWLLVRVGWVQLPYELSWRMLHGVGLIGGVGFTMSLFMSTLAFGENEIGLGMAARVGILTSSCICAVFGYCLLRFWALSRTITERPDRGVRM